MIKAPRSPFVCLRCRLVGPQNRQRLSRVSATARLFSNSTLRYNSSTNPTNNTNSTNSHSDDITIASRPPTAPKANIDIKHIRQNPALYEQTCLERNYKAQSAYPSRIIDLFAQWQARQRDGRSLRERSNALRRQIANPASIQHEDDETELNATDEGEPNIVAGIECAFDPSALKNISVAARLAIKEPMEMSIAPRWKCGPIAPGISTTTPGGAHGRPSRQASYQ